MSQSTLRSNYWTVSGNTDEILRVPGGRVNLTLLARVLVAKASAEGTPLRLSSFQFPSRRVRT